MPNESRMDKDIERLLNGEHIKLTFSSMVFCLISSKRQVMSSLFSLRVWGTTVRSYKNIWKTLSSDRSTDPQMDAHSSPRTLLSNIMTRNPGRGCLASFPTTDRRPSGCLPYPNCNCSPLAFSSWAMANTKTNNQSDIYRRLSESCHYGVVLHRSQEFGRFSGGCTFDPALRWSWAQAVVTVKINVVCISTVPDLYIEGSRRRYQGSIAYLNFFFSSVGF